MFQLKIDNCHQGDIDSLSDALEETGALSITFTDQFDDPILEPAPGAAPLWPHVVVHALYTRESEATDSIVFLTTRFVNLNYTIEPLPEQDWERTCLDQFQPQQFGQRLWVCPSWLTPPVPDAVNLILDPGLAFGTGNHATTSLCLTWLDQANLNHQTIIDYGCGSGILALAALKLGAKHAYAVDIDEQALLATQNNALNNSIPTTQLTVSTPDALANTVDVLIANILLTPLIELRERFHALLKHKATLVVSGILAEQVAGLIEAYQAQFIHQTTLIDGDWALVEFTSCQ